MQAITALAQHLGKLHIQPIPEYLQLKAERKLVSDLQTYYAKHQSPRNSHSPQQQESSFAEDIEVLIVWQSAKPSQELLEILDSYQSISQPIWPRISELMEQLRGIALQYEVKDILQRKTVRMERLLAFPKHFNLENHSLEVR